MSKDAFDAQPFDPLVAVEASRAKGAAQVDPVRFGVIDALARRAAAQQGEARELMARRVEAMLAEHTAATAHADHGAEPPIACHAALRDLSSLVDRLGRSSEPRPPSPDPTSRGAAKAEPPKALSRTRPLQALRSVAAFKSTWSRLRADARLRETLAQVPAAAGPLNTSQLVNRALQAMRELSPEYLDAFISHVDTLQWLERASGAGDLMPRATVAPIDVVRRTRRRDG